MKYDANIIVIGAGSGGLVSAYIAAALKAKVILIEQGEMGGDCLNTGCVPSKALIASAKFLHDARHAKNLGIARANVEFDFADVMRRVRDVIARIAPHDSPERYRSLGVEVVAGRATILDAHMVEVAGKKLRACSLIIAAGGEPMVPPIPGLDQMDFLTSDNVWELTALPQKLALLGGGPIGCELAQCFARFGAEVTLVEMLPQILPREDDEVATYMRDALARDGVRILTSHRAVEVASAGARHVLRCDHQDARVEIECDQILVAVGRVARLHGYGLENLNLDPSAMRAMAVNDYLQVGRANVYAVGDVTGPYQFTHAAAHQAWFASVNALFAPFKKFKINYDALPWATYTDPEVARVGLNERDAKARGVAYEVSEYDLSDLDRAITDGHAGGKVKVLTKPGKDKILGATIVGRHAGDLIAEFVLAMQHGLGLNKILGTIHAYPTWMEANKFAAGVWRRDHAPQWALNLLEKFHRMRR